MTLPLTGHASGRAGPLTDPAPETPAAHPAPEPEAAQPVQAVILVDDSDDPDVTTPLADDATTADIAAAAGRFSRGSELARQDAERGHADAARIMAEARQRAEAILREAETEAHSLTHAADQAGHTAGDLADRAQWLANGASIGAQADEAEAWAGVLAAEREQLTARLTDLDGQLARLAGERQDAEARLEEARERADVDAVASLLARLDGIADLAESAGAQRTAALDRLAAIGDGTPNLPGELAAAIRTAGGHRRALRRVMNDVWTARPEAVNDRERTMHQAAMSSVQPQQGAQRRSVVHL